MIALAAVREMRRALEEGTTEAAVMERSAIVTYASCQTLLFEHCGDFVFDDVGDALFAFVIS